MKQQKTFAFISYSRKDKRIANWLHKKIEGYAYPKSLVNEEQRPAHPQYVRPVFLDTKDLQVEVRPFTERIQSALGEAEFLIVICSRNSVKSSFVNKEIQYFLEKHEGNYARIVPLFVDEVQDDTIPIPFFGTSIMSRHFPIYNTVLNENSEANVYCFYQIVAYILGVNFSDLYNRYEVDAKKKKKSAKLRIGIALLSLSLIIVALGFAIYESHLRIEKGKELIKFEKKVFPAAVVFGYEENFLSPIIRYLKEENEPFIIYVTMPTSYRGLHHQDRIADVSHALRNVLKIDSLSVAHLPTSTKRGSHIHYLMKDGLSIPGIYLDFASTTTSFIKIAEYKKGHPAYRKMSIDSIISEYTGEFIEQTNKRLEGDSVYVQFVTNNQELIQHLLQRIGANHNIKTTTDDLEQED